MAGFLVVALVVVVVVVGYFVVVGVVCLVVFAFYDVVGVVYLVVLAFFAVVGVVCLVLAVVLAGFAGVAVAALVDDGPAGAFLPPLAAASNCLPDIGDFFDFSLYLIKRYFANLFKSEQKYSY